MENYTIYDEVGRGTHSFVYKARRKRSVEYVAVKSTAKSRMDKILNEVQILHKLDSRYVLKFYNWYESQNHIWLILEYCIGGDLLNLITQDRRLPESAVQTFGADLVAGLHYLHTNGIVFCDLKPANILIDECGSLKLADFGLARRIPTAESIAARPMASGSPNYMAPELFQPAAIHSFASDFWALGCVLYELCTGRPPFTHTFFPELARIIQSEPLMIPSEGYQISSSFADLLQRLLEKDPYRRITWPELIAHPFWGANLVLNESPLPPQALFEASRPRSELRTESESVAIHEELNHEIVGQAIIAERLIDSSTDSTASSDGRHSEQQSEDGPTNNSDSAFQPTSNGSESGSDDDLVDGGKASTSKVRPSTAPAQLDTETPTAAASSQLTALRLNLGQGKVSHTRQEIRTKTAPPIGRGGQQSRVRVESSLPKKQLIKAARLLFMTADSVVKPIAFCNDIENQPVLHVDQDQLEFEPLSAEALLACSTEDLEDHLKSIYISLKSSELSVTDKKNVLIYLFQLSVVSKLANIIVNSSLLSLLIKMLRLSHGSEATAGQAKHGLHAVIPTLTLVLGSLFRFATFISAPSPEQIDALVTTLIGIIEGSGTAGASLSKRRAMTCLGELLFYLSTQQDGSLPSRGLRLMVKVLDDEDFVTQHYALRTIANILTQGVEERTLDGFLKEETGLTLLQCFAATQKSVDTWLLRTTNLQALAQFFRRNRLSPNRTRALEATQMSMMVAAAKPNVINALWESAATGLSCSELAIAALNVINSFLEMRVDRDRNEDVKALIATHRQLLLEKIVDFEVLKRLLDVRSKFEEDSQAQAYNSNHSISTLSADSVPRRRYNDEDPAYPSLVRAKVILLIHFGILRSAKFARSCVRHRIVDKIELSMPPFLSSLREISPSPESIKQNKPKQKSPRQLPVLDQYVLQCCQHVVRTCIRIALKMSAECISSANAIAYEDEGGVDGQPYTSLIASEPFELFDQLIKNPACRIQLGHFFLSNDGKEFRFFIRLMSKLLTSFSTETLAAMGTTVGAVISRLLLRLFQGSSSDAGALVMAEPNELFAHLLPALVVQLLRPRESDVNDDDDDHSVNCIQLIYLVMLHLEYDLDTDATKEQQIFVKDHLLPCYEVLFGPARQNENVWRFAVDLLHGLVSQDPRMLSTLLSKGLDAQILALLSAPSAYEYHSLPSSATGLVRQLIESCKKSGSLGSLYTLGITRHVREGLKFAVKSYVLNTGTADLLEALYLLLHHRYEERRRASDASSPLEFEKLVDCGPLLLHLCGNPDANPHSSSNRHSLSKEGTDHESAVHIEVLESASRCLIFLSQLFGAALNEVLFGGDSARSESSSQIQRSLVTCLRSSHERFLLHILLTIKNSLRCDKKSTTPFTKQFLKRDKRVTAEISRISKRGRGPSPMSRDRNAYEQIMKAATEILSALQPDH